MALINDFFAKSLRAKHARPSWTDYELDFAIGNSLTTSHWNVTLLNVSICCNVTQWS